MKESGIQAKHPTRETTLSRFEDPAQAMNPRRDVKAALYKFFSHLMIKDAFPVDKPKSARR